MVFCCYHMIGKGGVRYGKKGINIHKRKDGRWEGRYKKGRNYDGSLQYGYVYGKTYSEVKEKMLNAIANTSKYKSKNNMSDLSFSNVLEEWMQFNKVNHKGATEAKYQFIIDNHINPILGEILVSQLNSVTINRYLNEKLENGRLDNKGGLSASYVRTISIIINSALKYAVNEELCTELKLKINKPAIAKHDLTILELETQLTLERYISEHIEPTNVGIMITLHTGLRIGEICALTWDNIDMRNRIIRVRSTVARVKNTGNSKHKTRLPGWKNTSVR